MVTQKASSTAVFSQEGDFDTSLNFVCFRIAQWMTLWPPSGIFCYPSEKEKRREKVRGEWLFAEMIVRDTITLLSGKPFALVGLICNSIGDSILHQRSSFTGNHSFIDRLIRAIAFEWMRGRRPLALRCILEPSFQDRVSKMSSEEECGARV